MRRAGALLLAASAACLTTTSSRFAWAEDDEVLVRGKQSSGFVSQAKIEDSPREITDAASLVEPLPGVHVRRLGSDDSFATLSVRGTSSSQVAVYLAGVPLTGGADPTLDLATLPLWPGARARVYRSFTPAALGRGSLGGALVLSPPGPRDPPQTDVWAAVGAYGARRIRVGDVRGDPDGVRVATGFSASRSDDDFSYLDPNATLARGSDVFVARQNAGHAAASGLASIAIPVKLPRGERGALTITTLAQARRQELPGTASAPTLFQRLESSRLVSAIELTLPAGSGNGALGFRLWGRREGLAIHDARESAQFTLGPTSTSDAILAAGGSVGYRATPTSATSIEVRIDGSAERFAPGTWIGALQPPAARRTNGGAALDATARAGSIFTFSASGRGDAWVDASEDGPDVGRAKPSGNVGAEAAFGPVAIASHAGYLVRPPSFVERYGNRGAFIGDPDLRAESAFTVDAGARYDLGSPRKTSRALRLHLETAVFGTWAEDLITFVNTGAYGRAKATNIGEARIFGLEAGARASLADFELRVSHTALATANASACRFVGTACERPDLPGRPAHDFVADLMWERGPVRLRYGIDVVSGIQADLDGRIPVPARILHGAGARLAVPGVRGLSVTVDVRNLFDLRAAEYPGVFGPVRLPIGDIFEYPLPGRRVLVSARFTTP